MKARTITAILLLSGGMAWAQQLPIPATQPAPHATTRPYTAQTYDDAVRELHARGFPATLEDLQSPAVPDDQNAAILLTQAAKMIVPDDSGPRNSSLEYGFSLPYPQKWFELAEQSMVMHDELLKVVRKARSCPAISWNPVMTGKPGDWMNATLPTFSGQRAICNIVADAALLEHFKGNDAEALEYARDLVFLAEANGRRPFLVSHLVSTGMRAVAANTLHLIGTELHIADARKPSGAVTGQEATRQQCKEIIAYLLNETPLRDEYRRILLEERVYALNEMNANGMFAAAQWRQLLPQLLELHDCLTVGIPTDHLAAVTSQPLTGSIVNTNTKLSDTHRLIELQRIAAATALAARMYAEDHGAYPATLKNLVPDYLPQVPADPYAPAGAPVMYRAAKRPMVGSVGANGRDDQFPPPNRPRYSVEHRKPGEPDDQWFDLTVWRQPGQKTE